MFRLHRYHYWGSKNCIGYILTSTEAEQKRISYIDTITKAAATTGGEAMGATATNAAFTGEAAKGAANKGGAADMEQQPRQGNPCEHQQKQQPKE